MSRLTGKAKRRRRTVSLASPLVLSSSFHASTGAECPPMLNGWIPTPGCKQYYLCEGGKRASNNYDCREGFLFDVSSTNCQQAGGVTCKAIAGDPDEPPEQSTKKEEQTPPGHESCGGMPVVYFVDIPNQTCYSNCQMAKPDWISEIFPTREECCEKNFQWMPVEDCASKDFVSGNKAKMWTLAPTLQEDTPAPVPGFDQISSPTLPPIEPSRDDPSFFFMCGVDWGDASSRCYQRCPNGEDDECPEGEGCFSETSCINGVFKDTPAPSDRPTPHPTKRTRKPQTAEPSNSPAVQYPSDHEPTKHPLASYITHKPTNAATDNDLGTHYSIAEMSAVHEINVIDANFTVDDVSNSTWYYDDDQGNFTWLEDDDEINSTLTLRPSREPTRPPRATRLPRPNTPKPTDEATVTTPSPTSAHFEMTQRPNYVVTLIATPDTSSIETMSESKSSQFNEAYGFGTVPIVNTNQQVSQDSEGSQYSVYDQIYTEKISATESPLPFEDVFFGGSSASISELIIPVSADATVSPKRPDLNFGLNSMLALDGGDAFEQFDILLKFDVSIVDKTFKIKSATLKIYATEGCPFGGSYYSTTSFNSDWDSSSITWNNAPKSLALLDSLEGISADHWYNIDVMPVFNLRSPNYVTIRVESKTMGRCMFASMEQLSGNAPYILLETERQGNQVVSMSGSITNDSQLPIPMQFLPLSSGEFSMIRASADCTIDAIRVNEKLGALPSLHISLSISPRQIFESLILFDLAEFQQHKPKSAMLTLFPEMRCHSAGRIALTGSSDEWSDKEMNWANAPESEFVIGTFGSIQAGHWHGFNVLKALEWAHERKMESITFRLSSDGDYSCQYSSIQSGRAPKLIASF